MVSALGYPTCRDENMRNNRTHHHTLFILPSFFFFRWRSRAPGRPPPGQRGHPGPAGASPGSTSTGWKEACTLQTDNSELQQTLPVSLCQTGECVVSTQDTLWESLPDNRSVMETLGRCFVVSEAVINFLWFWKIFFLAQKREKFCEIVT